MHCPGCNMPIDEEGTFCGHCGKQLPSPHTRAFDGASKAAPGKPLAAWPRGGRGDVDNVQVYQARREGLPIQSPSQSAVNFPFDPRGNSRTPLPIDSMPTPIPPSFSPDQAPYDPHISRKSLPARSFLPVTGTRRNMVFLGIILTILLVGVLASALTLYQHKPIPSRYTMASPLSNARASASFSDARQDQKGDTNSVMIRTSGLELPPSGSHYAAWLLDDETEHISPLGTLVWENSAFVVNFQHGDTNLLSQGNRLEVTQESAQTSLPTGHVILSARLPALALVHIKHLLVSFPGTPGNIGLLVGLREQTRQLYRQAQLLKDSTSSEERVSCVAQSIINMIEGSHGKLAQPLEPACTDQHIGSADDSYGLLGYKNNGYVPAAAMHASLAATQPDTTDTVRAHAQEVISATDNLTIWLKAIDQDAQSLLNNPGNRDRAQDMIELSERTLNGIDLNKNGRIDPVRGEAGANSAYVSGQAMADLTLLPLNS